VFVVFEAQGTHTTTHTHTHTHTHIDGYRYDGDRADREIPALTCDRDRQR
jgi:predicted  nucleic acid-binding Zn ribbon protein